MDELSGHSWWDKEFCYTLYVLWLMTSVVDNNQYSFWLKSKNCVPLIMWIERNFILEAGHVLMQLC